MKNKHSLALAGGAVLVLALLSYPRWSGWLRSETPASGTNAVPCINGSLVLTRIQAEGKLPRSV